MISTCHFAKHLSPFTTCCADMQLEVGCMFFYGVVSSAVSSSHRAGINHVDALFQSYRSKIWGYFTCYLQMLHHSFELWALGPGNARISQQGLWQLQRPIFLLRRRRASPGLRFSSFRQSSGAPTTAPFLGPFPRAEEVRSWVPGVAGFQAEDPTCRVSVVL